VAMDYSFAVGCVQRVGHLNSERQRSRGIQWPAGNPLAERFAFQQLHDKKWMPRRLAHVVHDANIRMIEGRGRACFSPETSPGSFIWKCLRQNFYRDIAMQSSVPSPIHFAHTAFADRSEDLVRTELIA